MKKVCIILGLDKTLFRMKISPNPTRASGFTLVELLVVVAIISIIATITVNSIHNAQRQARAAKCSANMHALHQAVRSYYADNGSYPVAGAYERHDKTPSGDVYWPERGWVNWVRTSTTVARRKSPGNLYPKDGAVSSSKASQHCYVGPGCGANDYSGAGGTKPKYTNIHLSRVYRSIDEGAIFTYTDKNFSIYCCDEFKAKYGRLCMRSYAMNYKYGSRRHRIEPLKESPGLAIRTAMFVELGAVAGTTSRAVGQTAGTAGDAPTPKDYFYNDSAWDWGGDGADENIGEWHRSGNKMYGHVLFADGHIESLSVPMKGKSVDTSKAKEQREALGKGSYGD